MVRAVVLDDVYELFLTWALLGLPVAVAARWSVATIAWAVVLDTALLLFCGWHPSGGLLWYVFGGTHFQPAHLILIAAFLNLRTRGRAGHACRPR